jgi:hypothetical protein
MNRDLSAKGSHHSSRAPGTQQPAAAVSGSGGAAGIGEDDYFLRSEEFRVWLKLAKNMYQLFYIICVCIHPLTCIIVSVFPATAALPCRAFESLSSDANRAIFVSEFVPAWNSRQLPNMYYNGAWGSVYMCDG